MLLGLRGLLALRVKLDVAAANFLLGDQDLTVHDQVDAVAKLLGGLASVEETELNGIAASTVDCAHAEREAWRDRRLMALIAHKREAAKKIGD